MRNLSRRAIVVVLSAVFSWASLGFAAENNSPVPVIDLDFFRADFKMAPADPNKKAEGRVTGSVPSGWLDDSSWANVNIHYQLLAEEGLPYLAMKVSEPKAGYAGMKYSIPDYGDGSLFKLTIKARGTAGVPVDFGIRMVENPWKFVWSQKTTFETTWRVYDFFISLDHNTQAVGFWLDARAAGEVDVAKVKLERVSREQLVAEMKKRYPDNGPANVLRSSRLPLGLQSGWAPDRDSLKKAQEPEIFADRQSVGVSGYPALHLKSVEKLSIYSEPFAPPVPIQKYTASIFVKGKGTGKLVVQINRKGVASKEFTATEQWQRVEVPFDPRMGEKIYALRLDTTGDILVDAWQVSPGDKAMPYQSQLPVEVALACPAADTAEAHVQFSDEAPLAEYYVSGNPFLSKSDGKEAPKLHAKVVNVYGEQAEIKPIALENKNINSGKFEFNLFPKRSFGPFRIETWVADAKGKRISAYQELVIYRLHRPRYWGKDAPDSPFGAHVEADVAHVKMAKAIGNNWVRLHDAGLEWIGWNFLEPVQGQWTFYDDAINSYRKQHLKILGSLSTSPIWASALNRPTRGGSYFDKFSQPKDLAQFGNYVSKVVAHYKGVIDTYEVWNEPWNAAWFGRSYDDTKTSRAGYHSGEHPQAEYAAIVKTANEAAKAADPGVTIVGLNTTTTEKNTKPYPDTGGADWSKGIKALDSDKDCDILGYHQYDSTFQGFPGDAVEKGFHVAVGPFREAGVTKPAWMTEGSSVMGYQASGFYNRTLPYLDSENVRDTANRICRFVVSLRANHVSKIFLYSMGIYGYFGAADSIQWPSMVTEEGYLHPSAAAFSQLAWELEDTQFDKCIPLGAGSFAYLFTGKNRSIAVISPAQQKAELSLPARADWTTTDLLGNPLPSRKITSNELFYIESNQPLSQFELDISKLASTATAP